MSQLTFGSLFSGIGGLDLGFERAGMVCKWQVEINPFCQRVLFKHWPDVKRYGDIKDIDFTQVEKVDIICGGFPCQPTSLSGKRLAQNDERWLWPEFARAIRNIRPSYVVVENVPGLLSAGFDDVLRDLAAGGYNAEWQLLSAAAFGAPHQRERVFIVAYANGNRFSFPKLREASHSQKGNAIPETESLLFPAWPPRPGEIANIPRTVDGVSSRVDRLRAIGNAVMPIQAEWIARLILRQANKHLHPTPQAGFLLDSLAPLSVSLKS